MVRKQNFSRKRQAILETLRGTKIHPTAEWVHQSLKNEYPDLSLGTVYRNLAQFKEEGIILSLGVMNGQERFDGYITPHSHFICNTGGAVIDIEETFANTAAATQVEHQYGCSVECQKLVFYGVCNKCKVGH